MAALGAMDHVERVSRQGKEAAALVDGREMIDMDAFGSKHRVRDETSLGQAILRRTRQRARDRLLHRQLSRHAAADNEPPGAVVEVPRRR